MLLLTDAANVIQERWKKSWFKNILGSWSPLARFIDKPKTEIHPVAFMTAYLESSWFSRWWFKSYLGDFRHRLDVDTASNVLETMKNEGTYSETNAGLVLKHSKPPNLAEAMKDKLFNQHSQAICDSNWPVAFVSALRALNVVHLLNDQNKQKLTDLNIQSCRHILPLLNGVNPSLLTQDNFDRVINDSNIVGLYDRLKRVSPLTQDQLNRILSPVPTQTYGALLKNVGLSSGLDQRELKIPQRIDAQDPQVYSGIQTLPKQVRSADEGLDTDPNSPSPR